ncbi:MAG: aminotransferase class IV [Phycisphaerales bacterium]|nr:aminotransferase class IV [Phycisphaerales bacterium]
MQVWLNGEFKSDTEASIGVFDAAVQHAVGLFETMAARNGRVFRLDRHIDRLVTSAQLLALTDRLQPEPLAEAVERALEHSGLENARIRLTVTGGDLAALRGGGSGGANDPTVLVVPQPPTEYPEAFFAKGVDVIMASGRVNPWSPFAGHKTVNYWERIHALQQAASVGAGEALWADPAAGVVSGSVSNIFVVRDGVLMTPPARGEQSRGEDVPPVLPGITRDAVLELAHDAGIETKHHTPSMEDLLSAEEVFLTNASWHVLPVTSLLLRVRKEGSQDPDDVELRQRHVADGAVGAMTADLRGSLLALIERETSS